MGEVVNVIVAFAVIVLIVRWAASGSSDSPERTAAATLGFRPKNVTQDMVDTISSMFPDIPVDNIRYDLLRTGNVQQTSNKIIERGYLDAPPAPFYTLYPRTPNQAAAPTANTSATQAAASSSKSHPNLIERYQLQDLAAQQEKQPQSHTPESDDVGLAGKAAWEDTPEKREASLRERKTLMILAARQRLLAQKARENSSAGSGAASGSSPAS
ncbi:hypothetical protein HGRIS_014138 [Hohenbuehelia grisea]|uniref:CUE domain-containing protein n=1 Tax=Hohenbuehelia grisea TaxID=104357 RepID=A0ABR3JSG4_9AGAR